MNINEIQNHPYLSNPISEEKHNFESLEIESLDANMDESIVIPKKKIPSFDTK